MIEKLSARLPLGLKDWLRPAYSRLRNFLSESARKKQKTLTKEEIRAGLSRDRKGRLDEGELIRSLVLDPAVAHRSLLCVDVGAHFGSSARPLLESGWKVIAFEPDEENRKQLFSSLGKYIPEQLVVEEVAVSDSVSEGMEFYRSEVSSGISGLSSFHESHTAAGTVQTTTLEAYLENNKVESLDFLKIDTEGFDFHVLKGVPWEKLRPKIVLCEFEDRKTLPLGYDWVEMAEFLQGKGYQVWVSEWHPIVEYGKPHDWNRMFLFPGKLLNNKGWGNLIAFQQTVEERKMFALLNETVSRLD